MTDDSARGLLSTLHHRTLALENIRDAGTAPDAADAMRRAASDALTPGPSSVILAEMLPMEAARARAEAARARQADRGTLTDEQLDRAARLLCERRGYDAERIVYVEREPGNARSVEPQPCWKSWVPYLLRNLDLAQVVAEAVAAGPGTNGGNAP